MPKERPAQSTMARRMSARVGPDGSGVARPSRTPAHALALIAMFLVSLTVPAAPESQSDPPVTRLDRGRASVERQGGAPALASEPPAAETAPAGWMQAHRATVLWAEPDISKAARELPQWSYLKPTSSANEAYLLVEALGDGAALLPARGWVASSDVGPSGPPSQQWQLAVDHTSRLGPRWMGKTWPRPITAEVAALVDEESGSLLFGKNPHTRTAPASLTKIATAVVALERAQESETVLVAVDSREMVESTVMGLTPGESVSLRTLLFGLMLPSGNDAARAIAQHVGGTERRFVEMMNERMAQLGLRDTQFVNPHGLDASGHYSTPHDTALLARHAMRLPSFRELASARTYAAEGYELFNLNRLLWNYPGADGVKIGYTDAAGRAIVASAQRDGRRFYVSMMRSLDTVWDSTILLDYGFENFLWQ